MPEENSLSKDAVMDELPSGNMLEEGGQDSDGQKGKKKGLIFKSVIVGVVVAAAVLILLSFLRLPGLIQTRVPTASNSSVSQVCSLPYMCKYMCNAEIELVISSSDLPGVTIFPTIHNWSETIMNCSSDPIVIDYENDCEDGAERAADNLGGTVINSSASDIECIVLSPLPPRPTPSPSPSVTPVQAKITIYVDPVEVEEGDVGDRNVVEAYATVDIENPCEHDIAVNLATADYPETATPGEDYEDFAEGELFGQLKIAPGGDDSRDHQTHDVVDIFIIGDIDWEYDEVFSVNVDRVIVPTHCSLEVETEGAEVIIRDDDWDDSPAPSPVV